MAEKWLSRHMYGTLVYVDEHDVFLDDLRRAMDPTIYACCNRGYFARRGQKRVVLSSEGLLAMHGYQMAQMPERKKEADLTARTQRKFDQMSITNVHKMARKRNRVA